MEGKFYHPNYLWVTFIVIVTIGIPFSVLFLDESIQFSSTPIPMGMYFFLLLPLVFYVFFFQSVVLTQEKIIIKKKYTKDEIVDYKDIKDLVLVSSLKGKYLKIYTKDGRVKITIILHLMHQNNDLLRSLERMGGFDISTIKII